MSAWNLITVKRLKLSSKNIRDAGCGTSFGDVVKVSDSSSLLAEGPVWHGERGSLLWVNIIDKTLHEKKLCSSFEKVWQLPTTPSSIVLDERSVDFVWVLTNTYLCRFNLVLGELEFYFELNLEDEFRTNDGSIGPDGKFWFGTMRWKPERGQGTVFSIDSIGNITEELNGISIPNTFCWIDSNTFLLSDSFEKKCFSFNVSSKEIATFLNLSSTEGTPDGGAVDSDGNVWIAIWGASKVVCCSPTGEIKKEIMLPVVQPTSCCFGGPDLKTLFITSAKEGLENDGSQAYNLAGSVFSVNAGVAGLNVKGFKGTKDDC